MSAARQISRSPHQQAFTLVELLVTIAIAILASLLLASLSQARAKADQAACKNNVHQIGVGLQLYTGDFDGHYPPGWSPEYDLYWYRLVENYVGAKWPAINIDRTGIVQRREG